MHQEIWIISQFLAISAQNLTFPQKKIFNVGSILLCIIANICCKSMNYHCAIFLYKCITNTDTTYIFLFLAFYAHNLITLLQIRLFCPKLTNFRPNKLEIIDYIFGKFMNHHCANFYTIRSSNINTTNIFQFLTILYRIWLFCPKFANFIPFQLGNIDNIFRIVYEPPLCKIVYQWINKCGYDNYYPISCDFCIKMTILP